MTPYQIQFARALDLLLTPVCATLTAAGRSRGVDADGQAIKGLSEKLAAVPAQLRAIADYAEKCNGQAIDTTTKRG